MFGREVSQRQADRSAVRVDHLNYRLEGGQASETKQYCDHFAGFGLRSLCCGQVSGVTGRHYSAVKGKSEIERRSNRALCAGRQSGKEHFVAPEQYVESSGV